ncbi:MAG: hypothetical protein EDM74_06590 [Armatimonadetes bacterium]|nr:MAG: hypothetical protein EDM74_06590 [Armatimonadota bacterium]
MVSKLHSKLQRSFHRTRLVTAESANRSDEIPDTPELFKAKRSQGPYLKLNLPGLHFDCKVIRANEPVSPAVH